MDGEKIPEYQFNITAQRLSAAQTNVSILGLSANAPSDKATVCLQGLGGLRTKWTRIQSICVRPNDNGTASARCSSPAIGHNTQLTCDSDSRRRLTVVDLYLPIGDRTTSHTNTNKCSVCCNLYAPRHSKVAHQFHMPAMINCPSRMVRHNYGGTAMECYMHKN